MGKLSDRIRELLARQVKQRGIVVWYDPDKSYTKLAQNLSLAETTVLVYTDGFFRLRHEIEPYLDFVTPDGKPTDHCNVPPNIVVYVPMERAQTAHALIEVESSGVVVEPGAEVSERNSRLRVQAETLFLEVAPEKAAHLARQVDEGLLTLEDLDNIADQVGSIASGALKLIFGAASPLELIIAFASNGDKDGKITEKNSLGELRALVQSELGLDFGETLTPAEARQTLRRLVLLAEFAAAIPKDARRSPLKSVTFPEKPIQVDALRHLCSMWRNRLDFREGYIEAARELENTTGIPQMDFRPQDVESVETFPCLETRLLLAAESLLLNGKAVQSLAIAEKRKNAFWSREQPPVLLRWSALELAARLTVTAQGIRESLKRISPSVAEMVRAYTDFTQPWMTADRLHRHWESRLLNIDPDEAGGASEFEQLVAKVRHDYAALVDELNRAFVRQVEAAQFEIVGVKPQSRIFSDCVAPAVAEGRRTVYLLVDALRYEMGAELLEGLSDDFEIRLEAGIGCLPSITPVGMAALLPGAEKGLELTNAGGRLAVVVEGQTLKDRQSRMDFFEEKIPKDLAVLKLAEVLKLSAKRKKELAGSKLIVVTSQEIDSLGEAGDALADTRRWMDEMLEQLRRAIRILARLGAERFLITADHGYLFADELDPGMMMDAPGGATTELHPRVWIGNGGQAADGYVRVTAHQLELGGNLELAFPRGHACFRVKGGAGGYFHGGISLQEMIIPVATLRSKSAKTTGAGAARINLDFSKPAVTNRFFSVVATLKEEGLFTDEQIRVRAVVVSGRTEAGFCAMAAYGYEEGTREIILKKNQPNALTIMLTGDGALEKVTVRLLDCLTQLELAAVNDLPVKLAI
jgi:PglZ domain